MTAPVSRHRLDPRMLVARVLGLSALRQQWGVLIPVFAVLGLRGGFRVAGAIAVVLVVLLVGAAASIAEWLRFSYAVEDGRLTVEKGILRRSLTVVPLDRIRGVDVHASAIQRLLGIAVVRVDAAATGGDGDEAVLDAVSAAEAERLRGLLLRQATVGGPARPAGAPPADRPAATAPAAGGPAPGPVPGPGAGPGAEPGTGPWPVAAGRPATPPARVLTRFQPRWLLYAPLVGSYLLAPLAALAAAQQVLGDLRVAVGDPVADAVAELRPGPAAITLAAAAAVVLAVVGAMATAAVTNWGFTLTRRPDSLVSERGLLSRRQVTLEQDRIRGYALDEPLPLRLAGAARLTALVTGLGGGEGERGRRGQLLPLGPAAVAREVAAAAVLPFTAPLRPHPPAARRRRLARATVPWLLLAAVPAAVGNWPLTTAALLLAAAGVPLGLDRYRGLGHQLDARAVSVRSGSLRRRQVVLDRRGVVGWRVDQSFFQRRAGLATVTVASGAGSAGYDVIDIGAADAAALIAATTPRPVAGLVQAPAPEKSVSTGPTLVL